MVRLEQSHDSDAKAGRLSPNDVLIETVEPLREMQIASLAHGLDRVLFNTGIHWLRDKNSGIYNFDPRIRNVLDVDLFDYGALPPYLTSSRDPELLKITEKEKKKYCGSTSSMTGLLSHCYYLLSRWKEPELKGFSASFGDMSTGFSEGAKLPVSICLTRQPTGFYAIDADKVTDGDIDNNNYVLTSLGKSLEKFLTAAPDEYAKYERVNSWKLDKEARERKEAYHYAKTSKLLMRSQLDCQDLRLPRKTFDLKTRAVVSVRHDRANYVEAGGYQIDHVNGLWESFEREYWDMARAAFLKYNFQARIGHMDGIFVAYHNTAQIFGFQYISLDEMNKALFGSTEMGDMAYRLCLGLLEQILDKATETFPDESLHISLETRFGTGTMHVIVQGAESKKITQLDVSMDRYLNDALVRGPVDATALYGPLSEAQLEDMRCGRTKLPGKKGLSWHVEYAIAPRHDLTEDQIRKHLGEIRRRQQALQVMCQPNVDLLNAREEHRVNVLAKRSKSLGRFLHERENGIAVGMPLAPGQLSTRELVKKKAPSVANSIPQPPNHGDQQIKWQRMPDVTTRKLRDLSRHGRERAEAREANDPLKLYDTT
ncbi:Pet127p [Malassezia vespertilionis]|uniref:Pet127p n=2 Tax=Malassezia vespertilionis TaxID=2020962 RepID=A0A2N1JDG5_9BASI|nr:Pet127p [Malassezia vespertilionis]